MMAARHRLNHLLELAADASNGSRQILVRELADLLSAWPVEYPLAMRHPFEQLLERTVAAVPQSQRAELAARFAAQPDAPVKLLNQLFFDARDVVKVQILRRNALASDGPPPTHNAPVPDEAALVAAARNAPGPHTEEIFAQTLGLGPALARIILHDPCGEALAAACKGAHLRRATFSALALLFAPDPALHQARLCAYDAVPQQGAECLMRYWRGQNLAAERSAA